MAAVFWVSLLLVIHPYVTYPLMLRAWRVFGSRPVRRDAAFEPAVTVLVPAYNEADVIATTLQALVVNRIRGRRAVRERTIFGRCS